MSNLNLQIDSSKIMAKVHNGLILEKNGIFCRDISLLAPEWSQNQDQTIEKKNGSLWAITTAKKLSGN